MRPSEIERLLAHLEHLREKHPVATAVDGSGRSASGDVTAFGPHQLVVSDPVTKQTTQVNLQTAATVRIAALGVPARSYGDTPDDDQTVVP